MDEFDFSQLPETEKALPNTAEERLPFPQESLEPSAAPSTAPEDSSEPVSAEMLGAYWEQIAQPPQKSRWVAVILTLLFLLIFGLGVYCIDSDIHRGSVSGGYTAGDVVNISIGTQSKPEASPQYQNEDGTYTIEGIAEAVGPSIVEIRVYESKDSTALIGSGSGVILSEDGYIVTNTHVLEGGEYYLVSVMDGDQRVSYDGTVVGRDAKTDIAVLKVDAAGLPAAVLGNSDEAVLGEAVVAIGNPAGLTGSVSNGIISGLDRKIRTEQTGFEMNCIQTNAPVSSGNSGGALINMYGQVIGIISSKYVSYGYVSYEGLGFAITMNEALPIIEDLITQGYVGGRFRIGITFYTIGDSYTDALFQEAYGFALPEGSTGLWIAEIADDCDIANSGLEVWDILIAIENVPVHDYDSLYTELEKYEIGVPIRATCVRFSEDGTREEIEISFCLMEDTSGDY